MKKFFFLLSTFVLSASVQAQDRNILNHIDLGVTVGTMGIGVDAAVPVGNSVRLRAGYTVMPRIAFNSDFPITTRGGGSLQDYVGRKFTAQDFLHYGIDLNLPEFSSYKEMLDRFNSIELKDYATMRMKTNVYHQFKFLVDVMPLRNKHFSITGGFFVGSQNLAEAVNLPQEQPILEGVNAYNDFYMSYVQKEGLPNGTSVNLINEMLYKNGLAGFNLGRFENGDIALMVPAADNSARATMEVNKFRPYLGLGYNTQFGKTKRLSLNVDAGLMFLCGAPKVFVDNVYRISKDYRTLSKQELNIWDDPDPNFNPYDDIMLLTEKGFDIMRYNEDWDVITDEPVHHVDLINDLHDIPGKVGNMVKTISRIKVYPNLSVTVSYRFGPL